MFKPKLDSPFRTYCMLITYAVLLVMFFINIDGIWKWVLRLHSLLVPFLYGIAFAYTLHIPQRFIETKLLPRLLHRLKKRRPRLERGLSVGVTVILALALVSAIFSVLIPQLLDSLTTFVNNIQNYINGLDTFFNGIVERFHLDDTVWTELEAVGRAMLDEIVLALQTSLPEIVNITRNLTTVLLGGVFNLLMGVIISIYLLFHREKLMKQLRTLLYAFASPRQVKFISTLGAYANDTFSRFLGGQLTEALILGVLCFIGMSILGIQYSLLISVIIGVTNLIPIFGPWIGAAISGFILLMINPVKALWFIIFIVVLQQLENNLIYPKVVGSSIGLSGLWVIFAILVGGGLFGFRGIFLGIPTFAVVYKLLQDYLRRRLARRAGHLGGLTPEAADNTPPGTPSIVPPDAPSSGG